jgi:hypothetical protein
LRQTTNQGAAAALSQYIDLPNCEYIEFQDRAGKAERLFQRGGGMDHQPNGERDGRQADQKHDTERSNVFLTGTNHSFSH